MTRQRAVLLEIFRSEACCGQHKSADEIFELAKAKMPTISRATVYNNLRSMEEEGLIRRITGDYGTDVYDASFELHGHIICTRCHKIWDFKTPRLLEELSAGVDFELESYELKIRCICSECKAKN